MLSAEFGESIVRQLATPIIVSIVENSGKAFGQLGEALQEKIYLASEQYNRGYIERHGTLKVLGMREPIPLESVYVEAQFLDDGESHKLGTIEVLEEVYRRSDQRGFQYFGRQSYSGIEIANQKQYLMVLGEPGMGKTTFLRKLGLIALKGVHEGGFQHDCIPVFIELKGFRTANINIENSIAEVFKIRGFPEPYRFTTKALERGKLLVLLDGLDEVPSEHMHEIVKDIQDFVDRYDKNHYIVSCRLAAYRYNFRRFTDVTLAGFNDTQIENFIANWFSSNPERGQECWRKLVNTKYSATKELTHTPLLLTLICLLYERAGQFPTNRATLYEKALRVLLEEWAGEKEIPQEPIYKGLDTKRKELMLAEIAYQSFREDRLFLHKREIASQIQKILSDMLPDEKHINGEAVLKSIAIQHGILVERAEGIYSFSHLTFQEFLAAQYIIDDELLIENIVQTHIDDERWREVFLLLSGLKRADDLLLKLEEQVHQFTRNVKLQALLSWGDMLTSESGGNYKPVVKRAIALFITLNLAQSILIGSTHATALNVGIECVQDLASEIDASVRLNRIIDVTLIKKLSTKEAVDRLTSAADELKEMKILEGIKFNSLIGRLESLRIRFAQQKNSPDSSKKMIEVVNKAWLIAFNLDQSFFANFSRDDISAINRYLYINLLVVQCRKAAVCVSHQTWNRLEERMLKKVTFNPRKLQALD